MKTHLSTLILFTITGLPMLLPFVTFLPLGNTGYEITKVMVFLFVMVSIFPIVMVYKTISLKTLLHIMIQPGIFFFFLWVGWNTLISFTGQSLVASFWGDLWYAFGLLELFILGLYFIVIVHYIKPVYVQIIPVGFAIIGFIQSYAIILVSPLYLNVRSVTTLGEPNWLGSILMVCCICTSTIALRSKKNHIYFRFAAMMTVAIVIAILSTGSRSTILASGITLTVLTLTTIKKSNSLYIFYLMIGLLVAGTISTLLIALKANSIYTYLQKSNMVATRGVEGTDSRLWIYEKGVQLFLQKPLTGWGWEQIEYAYKQKTNNTRVGIENLTIPRSHNLFLDLLLSGGVVSASLFSAYIVWTLRTGTKLIQTKPDTLWATMSLFALLLFGMFNPFSITHWVIFIFFSGILIKISRADGTK